MRKLKAFQVINNSSRISSVDFFRGLAIISVVLYHFNNTLPYGYLGVDLFFVVSGLLVGGLLTKKFENGEKIHFSKFFIQRGFKIWPSYYVFIIIGSLLAMVFYSKTQPDQIIPFSDLPRYLFFYQNYTGLPFHWSFDHVWSLCVEEHFYIILPLIFIIVQFFFPNKNKRLALLIFIGLFLFSGIVFKHFSYFFTTSKDTYSGTHNRIDALSWGVLLNLIIKYYGAKIRLSKLTPFLFVTGLSLLVFAIYSHIEFSNVIYEKIYFHTLIPFSFFLVLLSLYYVDFSKLFFFRLIAYYSYNWYLWHPVFVLYITKNLGNSWAGLIVYLVVSFLTSVFFTITVEEIFIGKREAVLDKLFRMSIPFKARRKVG